MLDEGVDPPVPFERQAADRAARRGHRLRAGRAWPPPTTCCSPATTSPSSSATRRPAGCSATASRSTACPRSRSSRPSTSRSPGSAARSSATPGLGRDFTLDDLQNQGFDAVVVAIGCYDTNKLGIPGEDAAEVLDGLEYLRTATLGLPYPGHAGKRVVVIGGGFTSMDCSRTSVRQGAAEVTLVYRRDMKDMPAAERGPRGDRGRRHAPSSRPARSGSITDEKGNGHRRRVHPDGARRARRLRPAPPGARARHRVHDPVRPRAAGDRPGPGARLARPGPGRGPRRPSSSACKADAVTFETGRPGVFGTGDVRIGAATVVQAVAEGRRAAYAVDAYLKGLDLAAIRTRQTLAEPQPEFLSIVPFTSEVKEPRYRLKAMRGRGAQPQLHRVRDPVHAARRRSPSRRAASSAPARRSASATCAAWASSTARRSRRSSRSSTRAPASGA